MPSWRYMVDHGATTVWERWDGWTEERGFHAPVMNSFNHYAFGSVAEYLYRFVGGIDTDGVGFRKISIAPQPSSGLTEARTNYDSPTGKIATAWMPILIFFAQGFEHSVVNMFIIPTGMMMGAKVSVAQWWVWNQIPVTLGNIVGGFLFTGLTLYVTYKPEEKQQEKKPASSLGGTARALAE